MSFVDGWVEFLDFLILLFDTAFFWIWLIIFPGIPLVILFDIAFNNEKAMIELEAEKELEGKNYNQTEELKKVTK